MKTTNWLNDIETIVNFLILIFKRKPKMKNVQLSDETARKIYPTAAPELKAVLEETFGKEFFSQKLTDRINTFDDVLEIAGQRLADVIPYPKPKNDTQKALNAVAKLYLIADVLNEGWLPDWTNSNQGKYYPYFEQKHGAFSVSYTCYVGWSTYTTGGSRLCFKNSALAEFAGRTFEKIYNDHLTKAVK